MSPMTRLYVTLVKSKTNSPGRISADKYRITVSNEYTSFINFCKFILEINSQNCNKNDTEQPLVATGLFFRKTHKKRINEQNKKPIPSRIGLMDKVSLGRNLR